MQLHSNAVSAPYTIFIGFIAVNFILIPFSASFYVYIYACMRAWLGCMYRSKKQSEMFAFYKMKRFGLQVTLSGVYAAYKYIIMYILSHMHSHIPQHTYNVYIYIFVNMHAYMCASRILAFTVYQHSTGFRV